MVCWPVDCLLKKRVERVPRRKLKDNWKFDLIHMTILFSTLFSTFYFPALKKFCCYYQVEINPWFNYFERIDFPSL